MRPGEVSLASNGVLFLDDLEEFRPSALQGIRQPLKSGQVTIVRADGRVDLPARFLLVASASPCPCGYYGDKRSDCTCSPSRVEAYRARLGGPLGRPFGIRTHVDASDMLDGSPSASSTAMREGVLRARKFAAWRSRDEEAPPAHQTLDSSLRSCRLESAGERMFRELASQRMTRFDEAVAILAVARTIADMDERERVGREDLLEAFALHG